MTLLEGLTADDFSRWFLAAFFMSVAVFYTIRVRVAGRRAGRSPVDMGPPGSRHRWHHRLFHAFRVAILMVCVARAIWPGLDPLLVPLPGLWHPLTLIVGDLVLLISFVAVLYINAFMAQDWRSGIDHSRPPALITSGPFARSRNPMFTAIQVGQLGLFLALPSVFTLVCLIVGIIVLHRQVRLEERHLARHLGCAYDAYRAKVPRWLALPCWPGRQAGMVRRDHGRPAHR